MKLIVHVPVSLYRIRDDKQGHPQAVANTVLAGTYEARIVAHPISGEPGSWVQITSTPTGGPLAEIRSRTSDMTLED